MYKIIIKSYVNVSLGYDSNNNEIKVPQVLLKKIHGYTENGLKKFNEDLSFYMELNDELLINLNPPIIQEGAPITLYHESGSDNLIAESIFISEKKLLFNEIIKFMNEYDGQMSDGIGSGMLQEVSSKYNIECCLSFEEKSIFKQYILENN